jgi:DNA-binding response OmpR family regulator
MAQRSDSLKNPGAAASRPKLLVVDDDRELCLLIADYLGPLGYDVESVHDGRQGLELALQTSYAAIILDVMLPGIDGFEFLRRLRAESETPVLMLTARGDEVDRIVGLECGADDYLPKTFSTRELLARLRAVIRRSVKSSSAGSESAADGQMNLGALHIHPSRRLAVLGDEPLDLTGLEFDLLLALARARGRVKSREDLVAAVAHRNYDVFDRSVDVHICSLRKKLGDDPKNPRFIRSVRSIGYMLMQPER